MMPIPTVDAGALGRRTYFRSQRLFYHAPIDGETAGWCFTVRGGHVYGPFATRDTAERILTGMIEEFRRNGDTGGR